jgi:hypothetical protein
MPGGEAVCLCSLAVRAISSPVFPTAPFTRLRNLPLMPRSVAASLWAVWRLLLEVLRLSIRVSDLNLKRHRSFAWLSFAAGYSACGTFLLWLYTILCCVLACLLRLLLLYRPQARTLAADCCLPAVVRGLLCRTSQAMRSILQYLLTLCTDAFGCGPAEVEGWEVTAVGALPDLCYLPDAFCGILLHLFPASSRLLHLGSDGKVSAVRARHLCMVPMRNPLPLLLQLQYLHN